MDVETRTLAAQLENYARCEHDLSSEQAVACATALRTLSAQLAAAEQERDRLAARITAFEQAFGDSGRGYLTVRDLCYTAFMRRAQGRNPDDGGPCDWFTDTRPLIEEGIAKILARAALSQAAPPAQEAADAPPR